MGEVEGAGSLTVLLIDDDADCLHALQMLQRHDFPGNVRELRNLIEQAAIFCRGRMLSAADLGPARLPAPGPPEEAAVGRPGPGLVDSADLCLACLEQQAIREALRRSDGRLHEAADLLGITRFALKRRMERYGIG
ncbi:MAG: helix-turn-helix domain-containing protein [Candidatus Latescibacterota bacterium]